MTKQLRQAILDTIETVHPLLQECKRQGVSNLGQINFIDAELVVACHKPMEDLAYHFSKECKKHGKFVTRAPHAK